MNMRGAITGFSWTLFNNGKVFQPVRGWRVRMVGRTSDSDCLVVWRETTKKYFSARLDGESRMCANS